MILPIEPLIAMVKPLDQIFMISPIEPLIAMVKPLDQEPALFTPSFDQEPALCI